MKLTLIFVVTAVCEILGCYSTLQWFRQGKTARWLIMAVASLAAFAWLLTLHDAPSGRVYAAYGGIYIGTSLVWLAVVDGCGRIGGIYWEQYFA